MYEVLRSFGLGLDTNRIDTAASAALQSTVRSCVRSCHCHRIIQETFLCSI